MRNKVITLLLSAVVMAAALSGCGNTSSTDSSQNSESESSQVSDSTAESSDTASEEATQESADEVSESTTASSYDELIASLHMGQSYAYAPICDGEDALLVTSYTYDDLEGHMATYEATIYVEGTNGIEKITTVQTSGTAYPIAVSSDNCLILSDRNAIQKAYVDKASSSYVVAEQSSVTFTADGEESYSNYIKDAAEIATDSTVYDELSDEYLASEILSFEAAGTTSDNLPYLAGGVYRAYNGDDLYNVANYIVFDNETSGHTQTPDGLSGVAFDYEASADSITFHFGSADDNSVAQLDLENASFPVLTFSDDSQLGSETVTLVCLGNADAQTFDAVTYYDNDNNLLMQVTSFDETSLTGDIYREERIKADYVDNAEDGSSIYSVNGTEFTVVSFEDANTELAYADNADDFKADVIGTTRFDGFLVKSSDGNYYALEKEDYEELYTVVELMNEGNIRKLIEENVTFSIKENCNIVLLKFVSGEEAMELAEEYIIGREFKGDNYPGWSEDATEYYMTSGMLVSINVVDGELYNIVQQYIP